MCARLVVPLLVPHEVLKPGVWQEFRQTPRLPWSRPVTTLAPIQGQNMTEIMTIFGASLFLGYANGANDNFKGVATLYGAGVATFKQALAWATISTFAGSMAAAVFAEELLRLFSGKGLVPDTLVGAPPFLMAVITGAGLTVFLTALRGIPISTTHALVGGIVGAGMAAVGFDLNFEQLGQSFVLPLALGPLIPIVLIGCVYPLVRRLVLMPALDDWIGNLPEFPLLARAASWTRMRRNGLDTLTDEITSPIAANIAEDSMSRSADILHFLSSGAVGFARGLNDTPKIVGIVMAAGAFDLGVSTFAVAVVMALGGLAHARHVAETMSHRITKLSPGRGTLANVVTSLLVIFASRWGLPVSTTHVSVGAIMGIGVAERNANWTLLSGILTAWVLTLPAALTFSAIIYWFLTSTGVMG